MELHAFDDKCVFVRTVWGEEFEGECAYFDEEYCESEFGRAESCVELANLLLFESDIGEIRDLGGPGGFSAPFGRLEELNIEMGADAVGDELTCEYEENARRMLRCLRFYADPSNGRKLPFDMALLAAALYEASVLSTDEQVASEAGRMLAEIES